jgi:hypothetical protein
MKRFLILLFYKEIMYIEFNIYIARKDLRGSSFQQLVFKECSKKGFIIYIETSLNLN